MVVLGGSGARLPVAVQLLRHGLAPTLVLSVTGYRPGCPTGLAPTVICFTPDPSSTQGEAEEIGRLARQHRWDRLVVVSGHAQARRAALRVRRCYAGALQVVPAAAPASIWGELHDVAYEAGATLKAEVWQRSC